MIDILTDQQEALRAQERDVLERLSSAIEPLEPPAEDIEAIRQAALDLDELFLLVVVGEFNSGKSAFINALLGEEVLQEGVTPTTATVTLLRYGETSTERPLGDMLTERTYPAPFLREITIVDTPGTNAIIRRHEELTRHFVPRSDLVLFITSADRPFTETERAFMETVRSWGKKIVLVLNKIDLLSTPADLERVMTFIESNSVSLLGQKPDIFPVSARLAKRASAADNPGEVAALRDASRFGYLEKYIFSTLDESGRIRLKLSSPLGVASRLLDKYREVAGQRLTVLAEDFRTVDNIDSQLEIYASDMKREFEGRLSQIENIIYDLRERGDDFFDETLRVRRIPELLNSGRVEREFQERVIADTSRRVDEATNSLIDWMVNQDLRMWQSVSDYINRRRQAGVGSSQQYDEHMIGSVGGQFAYNRDTLLRSVVQESRRVVESYDRDRVAATIAGDMRSAVGVMLGAGGAAALGILVAATVTSAFIDITGITAALVSGAIGLFVLPYRRQKAKSDFRERTQELRDRLVEAMTTQFSTELNNSLQRIRDAIAPYTRFVRMEHERVTTTANNLNDLDSRIQALQAEIQQIGR
jgi:small GTP-binding protein